MHLDVVFPTSGGTVATDHAYLLYAAVSRIVPEFHQENSPLRYAAITGVASPNGQLQLTPHSHFRVRLPQDLVKVVLPLAGKRLQIGEASIRLGVPAVSTLEPATSLYARIVTFKNAETPEQFLATARTKLTELGISGEPQLPIHLKGERAGEPKRRVLRIKGAVITGYALVVSDLSAGDSLKLQEKGFGGRSHLGCGFFTPAKGMV